MTLARNWTLLVNPCKMDPHALEFQDASLKMTGSVFELGTSLYKVFPTKAYGEFLYGCNYITEYGMHVWIYAFTVNCVSWLK